VILLTKKYPQMEILPARNLKRGEEKERKKKKTTTHFIFKETALTQEIKCAS
jgi:hypothetical protein